MSDIFSEINEDIRREQLQRMWKRYSVLIVAGAVLIVAAVGAWRGYEWYEGRRAIEVGTSFQQAMQLGIDGKADESQALFQKLAADGTSGYRDMARIQDAIKIATKDAKAGAAAFQAIAADNSTAPIMKDVAALRAGFILVDTASYEDMRALIEPLTRTDHAFRNSARELLALAAWRAGNKAEAKTWLDQIQNDPTASAGIRDRLQVMQALFAEDGNS